MGTEGREPQCAQRAVFAPEAIAAVLTAAAVLSGVVLRWFSLGKLSLWEDEGYTTWVSDLSPGNIVRFCRSERDPPLYYLLQHYWGALFGNSEFALRAFSAVFGTLSLPVFYFLAKKVLQGSMAVALAMWMFAFSLMQLWFSREGRSYELLSFLALVSLYGLLLFLERRSVALFASIVLSVAASLYMHNMMFLYLLALNVIWLIYPSERPWIERVKELLLADALLAVLYLPWMPRLLTQVTTVRKAFWAPRPTVSTFFGTLTVLAGFDLDYMKALAIRFLPLSPHTAWVCVLAGVGLSCAASVAGGLWGVSEAHKRRNVSLLLYCLLPILAVFVLSRIAIPLFIERYLISSTVVVPIVFAYPLALQTGRKGRILYGFLGIVLGATLALSGFGYLRYQEKEDWRSATSSLLRIPERNRLIVFAPQSGQILFDHYARRFPATPSGVATTGVVERSLERSYVDQLKFDVESKKYSEIDLVLYHDPYELVLDYLSRILIRQEEQEFHGVRIIRFRAPPH